MLDAMRNLGILKMIDELEEFDSNALESAEAFAEQKKNAIESGAYAKLQFEPIGAEKIGIFSIDFNGQVQFKEENVDDDSWKYLFLKTAPNGIYLTPTWKRDETKLKKNVGEAKLKRTVEKYIEDSKRNNADWLQKIVKIFLSNDIEIGELNENGTSEKKSFYDVIEWAVNNKNIKVFSIKIDGHLNADIRDLLDIALQDKPKETYQTKTARSIYSSDIKCSLCDMDGELFSNVLHGVGINIANVDKPVFFPAVDREYSDKAFPICASCAEALYAAKFHVFNSASELRQDISGHKSLIIPHMVKGNKQEGLDIIIDSLKRHRDDLRGTQTAERYIIKDLSQIKSISTVTFIIGEVSGQDIKNIRKIIPDVLISRLSEIANAIDETNNSYRLLSIEHPWKLDQNQEPIDGSLRIIGNILGMPKYLPPQGGKRAPFKASQVDSLDILSAIFLKRDYPLKDLIAEFSSNLNSAHWGIDLSFLDWFLIDSPLF